MEKINMINKRFGNLTVIKEVGITGAKHITYECICACGKIVERTGTSMRRSKNSNCGCYNPPSGALSPHWKGIGEISANWFDSKIRRSADGSKGNRKIKEVDIDIQYIWDLFLKQDRKCVLTGLELTFPKSNAGKSFTNSTASLDRIDSNKGYIKGNVQWVHKDVNMMKRFYTQEHFINMCKLVAIIN